MWREGSGGEAVILFMANVQAEDSINGNFASFTGNIAYMEV